MVFFNNWEEDDVDDDDEVDGDEDLHPPASIPIESRRRFSTLSVTTLYLLHSDVRKERRMDTKTKTAIMEM